MDMTHSVLPKGLEAAVSDAVTPHHQHHHGVESVEVVTVAPGPDKKSQETGLRRSITTRQMVFMAMSSSIGAGLMVASGQGLARAGPGSLVLGFAAVGWGVICTMAALGEMAAALPLSGSFYTYTDRFIGPAAGFAMAWNFCFNWLIVLPFEIVTIGAQLRMWAPESTFPLAATAACFLVFVSAISLLGARWFGEVENWLGMVKAFTLLIFIGVAASLSATGAPFKEDRTVPLPPGQRAYGATFWTGHGGAFRDGFRGFVTVFKIAGMAYGGTETLGLTAAECLRPHRLMRIATYITFFRIAVFYLLSLAMLGFVLPSDTPGLSPGSGAANPSPFILAMRMAGITHLEHLINAAIVAALTSMSNVAIFSSSRALHALACKGMAPRAFARTWKGVPAWPTALAIGFGLLAFIGAAPGGGVIFSWLLSLAGTSNYFTWLAICAGHIRFRAALEARGRGTDQLTFRSPFGVWGTWVGAFVSVCGLLSQIIMAFVPTHDGTPLEAQTVAMDVIGVPAILALFGGYMAYQRMHAGGWTVFRPIDQIDLDTGFRGRAELQREREELERAEQALSEPAAASPSPTEEPKPHEEHVEESIRRPGGADQAVSTPTAPAA